MRLLNRTFTDRNDLPPRRRGMRDARPFDDSARRRALTLYPQKSGASRKNLFSRASLDQIMRASRVAPPDAAPYHRRIAPVWRGVSLCINPRLIFIGDRFET